MSTSRISANRGWANPKALPKGPNGRAICRCGCGREVPKGRQTFFGRECVDGWKLRTQPGFVRRKLQERDHGVCALCGFDTEKARAELLAMLYGLQATGAAQYWFAYRHPMLIWPEAPEARPFIRRCAELGVKPTWHGDSLWQADHIVPVCEGGGECGLDGYRTLCRRCHDRETAKLAARRAKARRPQREMF